MNTKRKTVEFEIRNGPIYDVIVVGGGTTGVAAALAAARCGARVALIEYYGFLGGNAATGLGWLGFHSRDGRRVIGGIASELVEKLQRVGGATSFFLDPIVGSVVGINSHWWKLVAMDSTQDAGVAVYLHSLVAGVEGVERTRGDLGRGRVDSVCIQGRGGLLRLEGRVIVDCTDSGAVARLAGARWVRGRANDNKVQVASWTFQVGGVDFDKMYAYFRAHPEEIRPFPLPPETLASLVERMADAEVFVLGAFKTLIEAARNKGLNLPRENLPAVAFRKEKSMTVVATRIEDVDTEDVAGFSQAEMEGARQAWIWLNFLRQFVPGCAEVYLSGTPHQIGIRESNHVEGDYLLTGEDILRGARFEDAIALGAYHVDIHSPDHMGIESRFSPIYQIPYRSLIPKDLEGILLAGRPISATHEAMASTRVIPIGMAIGQAAGTAAAIASRRSGNLRDVAIKELREQLSQDGARLDETECSVD